MGLDMYLLKKTYIGAKYRDVTGSITVDGRDIGIKFDRIQEITEEVGYWRKANAIHQWFVDNVQDGEDECREHWVSEDKMKQLLSLVNKVLDGVKLVDGVVINGYSSSNGEPMKPNYEAGKMIENSELAHELLPTQKGFFFGSTDYDQWYYEDLETTKEILENALKEGGNFYYASSW